MSDTVALIAFAFKPDAGSEQEVGWSWMLAYLRAGWRVILIARDAEGQREAFQNWLRTNEGQAFQSNVQAHFLKASPLFEWIVRGEIHTNQKFMRTYFHFWQINVLIYIDRISKFQKIHHIHHCNFVSDTFIPLAGFLRGTPFVWGPIGGNRRLPKSMYKNNKEFLTSLARDIFRHVTWLIQPVKFRPSESFKIIAHGKPISEFVLRKLPQADPILIPNVYIDESDILEAQQFMQNSSIRLDQNGEFNIYSAGPFLSIKNFDISIEVLRLLCEKQPNVKWCLHLFGDGPLRASYEDQVRRVLPEGRMVFHGWVPRSDLQRFVRERASICLMPTFELGGAVPLEAHMFGIPVFCVKGRSISYYHERFLGAAVEADGRATLPQAFVEAISNFKITQEERGAGLAALSRHSRRVLTEFIETLKIRENAPPSSNTTVPI